MSIVRRNGSLHQPRIPTRHSRLFGSSSCRLGRPKPFGIVGRCLEKITSSRQRLDVHQRSVAAAVSRRSTDLSLGQLRPRTELLIASLPGRFIYHFDRDRDRDHDHFWLAVNVTCKFHSNVGLTDWWSTGLGRCHSRFNGTLRRFVERNVDIEFIRSPLRRRPALFKLRTQISLHGLSICTDTLVAQSAGKRRRSSTAPTDRSMKNEFSLLCFNISWIFFSPLLSICSRLFIWIYKCLCVIVCVCLCASECVCVCLCVGCCWLLQYRVLGQPRIGLLLKNRWN